MATLSLFESCYWQSVTIIHDTIVLCWTVEATADCMFLRSSSAHRGRTSRKCSAWHLANAMTTTHETSNISITAEPRGTEARVVRKCCSKRPRPLLPGRRCLGMACVVGGERLYWWLTNFFGHGLHFSCRICWVSLCQRESTHYRAGGGGVHPLKIFKLQQFWCPLFPVLPGMTHDWGGDAKQQNLHYLSEIWFSTSTIDVWEVGTFFVLLD